MFIPKTVNPTEDKSYYKLLIDYTKVIKVIDSCESIKHFESASALASIFRNKYIETDDETIIRDKDYINHLLWCLDSVHHTLNTNKYKNY